MNPNSSPVAFVLSEDMCVRHQSIKRLAGKILRSLRENNIFMKILMEVIRNKKNV